MKNNDIKILKNFKGNKRGADWLFCPADTRNKKASDIPKLKQDEVNVVGMIKRENQRKLKTILCKVSDLPDEGQAKHIYGLIDAHQKRLAVDAPEIKTGHETTVGDVMNAYIMKRVMNEKDCQNKSIHLEFWRGEIGDQLLAEIKPSHIRTAKAKLTQAPKTINNYLTSLRSLFEYAKKNYDDFESNPMNDVERAKAIKKEHRFLSDEERERMFEQIKIRTSTEEETIHGRVSSCLEDFVIFGIYIGCRKREALALWWDNIDFQKNEITFTHTIKKSVCVSANMVNGKLVQKYEYNVRTAGLKNGQRQRKLSFAKTPRIRRLLRERCLESSGDYIFEQDCATAWKSLLKASEIEKFRFHDLRHTCGSDLYQSGKSLDWIAKYLGQESIQSTQIYAELDTKQTEDCGEALTERYGS